MNRRRLGRALLWIIVAIATPAITSLSTAAEDNAGYSPYVGTWRLSGVPEQLTIALNKLAVSGSIGVQGRDGVSITGTIQYENIEINFDSPDGQRTVTLKGILSGTSIRFKRSASIHDGGSRGTDGIFGARGPDTLTATLIETRGSISGRVLDGASGQPLSKATITLTGLTSGAARMITAKSDDDGAFAFQNLPAGDYRAMVALQEYLPFQYGSIDSEGVYQGLGVSAGRQVKGVELRLTKTIAISGWIVDERGMPVAGAPVVAFVRRNTNGWDRLDTATPMSKPEIEGSDYILPNVVRATADASGRYRLDDMAPGDYYIQTQKPGNLAAGIGLPRRQCGTAVGTNNSATEGDVPLFYPEATDAGRATVVHAAPGGNVAGINFVLRPQRLGNVRVSIVRPASTDPAAENGGATIALVAAGLRYASLQPSVSCGEERDGTAEINGVVPGPYKLIAVAGQGDLRMVDIRDVYVESGSDPSATLRLRRGIEVRGQLRMENLPRGFTPSQLTVRLTPVDSPSLLRVSLGNGDAVGAVNADGSFVLSGVIPELPYRIRYSFPYGVTQGALVAVYGGKPLTDTLTVEDETEQLDLSFEP